MRDKMKGKVLVDTEQLMSELYGVYIAAAEKVGLDRAVEAVTAEIVRRVDAMDERERRETLCMAVFEAWCVYAGKIHSKASRNLAREKAARCGTTTARTNKDGAR